MYIVNLINPYETIEIHGEKEKLQSGSVVQGINAIDSFTFTMLPSNAGFDKIQDSQSLITVYNTNTKEYEFHGRPLYSSSSMEDDGSLTKEVICESYFGFFCDSQQTYVAEKNWTVMGLLEHIINLHNSQVESYKHFTIGEVTVADSNDNVYIGIQRENTWKTIEEKLIGTLGGEIRFRVEDGVNYLDYLTEIGTTSETEIALSKNMKSITKESDPTSFISRLIPYGCKLQVDGEETEERLDITSVNNGVNYLEDTQALERYGIKYGIVEFDDVTDASNLMTKGQEYLALNNKVQVKYMINALDLSLIGLDIDTFHVHNYHPITNGLLNIYDTARIIKKKIDICEEVKSSFDIGDNFKTLTDLDIEMARVLASQTSNTKNIVSQSLTNYVKNSQLTDYVQTNQLTNYVQTSQLANYVQTNQLSGYVLTSEMVEYLKSTVLWSGVSLVSDTDIITLEESVSEQVHGIVLCFSPYEEETALDSDFQYFFIPKYHVTAFDEKSISFNDCYKGMMKTLIVSDSQITGVAMNNQPGTSSLTGLAYDNTRTVLRAVIGL